MAFSVFSVLRKLDGLLRLEATQGEAIRRLTLEVAALNERVTRLEVRDEVLIARAEGAAAAAAGVASGAALADIARRVGAMEERARLRALPGKAKPPR